MKEYKNYRKCRACGCTDLFKFFKFETALAGAFIKSEKDFNLEKKYPLSLSFCKNCTLVQVNEIIKAEILFKNYFYKTGVIKTLVDHFKNFSNKILLENGSSIFEIGCNDLTFLKNFKGAKIKTIVGIDPSDIAQNNKCQDISLINDFFSYKKSKKIMLEYGKFDIITASNCFAHIENIKDVVKGIKNLLSENGSVFIEVHWLGSIIKNLQFPFIYHEHMYYYSLNSLINLFNLFGMDIYDVEEIDMHGGSIRIACCHSGNKKILNSINLFIEKEMKMNLFSYECFENFENVLERNKKILLEILLEFKNKNKKIIAYGASGQSTTLMKYYNLDSSLIDCIVDDSPVKYNCFTPNNHLKIINSKELQQKDPDYILCLAYTFFKEIYEKNKSLKAKWILPLPEVLIHEK